MATCSLGFLVSGLRHVSDHKQGPKQVEVLKHEVQINEVPVDHLVLQLAVRGNQRSPKYWVWGWDTTNKILRHFQHFEVTALQPAKTQLTKEELKQILGSVTADATVEMEGAAKREQGSRIAMLDAESASDEEVNNDQLSDGDDFQPRNHHSRGSRKRKHDYPVPLDPADINTTLPVKKHKRRSSKSAQHAPHCKVFPTGGEYLQLIVVTCSFQSNKHAASSGERSALQALMNQQPGKQDKGAIQVKSHFSFDFVVFPSYMVLHLQQEDTDCTMSSAQSVQPAFGVRALS
jgi:hypothetical protein